jgi:PBP1b-binding outer membrane lipoprotein LpoB
MKKVFVTLLFSLFLIAGCTNNTEVIQETSNQNNINIEQQNTQQPDIYETFKNIIKQQENCGDDSEMFIDIAIL